MKKFIETKVKEWVDLLNSRLELDQAQRNYSDPYNCQKWPDGSPRWDISITTKKYYSFTLSEFAELTLLLGKELSDINIMFEDSRIHITVEEK